MYRFLPPKQTTEAHPLQLLHQAAPVLFPPDRHRLHAWQLPREHFFYQVANLCELTDLLQWLECLV